MAHQALLQTDFQLSPNQRVYHGKVRDVYFLDDKKIVMVATDRISAFDVVLPKGIPGKGQVLNLIAAHFLEKTRDIVPNWLEKVLHPQVSFGKLATPFKVEMVVRGCLTGHAWRTYASGKRTLCGVTLPEGMKENQPFENPIITPTTKAEQGEHDADISREEIMAKGIVSQEEYEKLEAYSLALFARGCEMASERGLILVDTKYEFGKLEDGTIILIDEIHTPDSSRYFELENFDVLWKNGHAVRQLSKEFVRQWLMENGFSGKDGQVMPEMSPEVVSSIQKRYAELYNRIVGTNFDFTKIDVTFENQIQKSVQQFL
ncbi:MAG: phosphoribosylaminoimidazolesuccinocarboxamide synthase [Cryomorphaceae bacterium]|nr:phosphoribosylaminoimidazolesuccinocarboxamide synthase [Cryomorphaceae bacterium]